MRKKSRTFSPLDLFISSEEEDKQNLQINPSLGVSDHATIIFDFICTYKEVQNSSVKMQYSKYDTQGFEAEWETIDWDEKFKDLDLDYMWKKSSIGNLLKTDGTSTETDSEKADELNSFFASVFTHENLSNIPIVQVLNFDRPLETIDVSINQVEKLLQELNTTKQCSRLRCNNI